VLSGLERQVVRKWIAKLAQAEVLTAVQRNATWLRG
jgi:hypothetical protein